MARLFPALLVIASVLAADVSSADALGADTIGVTALSSAEASTSPDGKPKVLVKIGSLKTDPEFVRLTNALEEASREKLGELPGIRVLEESEDANAAAAKRRPPVVLITGKLAEMGQKDEGEEVLISAKVEYFVHRMPGESIAAVVSGVATARVAPIQMKKKRLRERLERAIVAAAVESAAKRTPPALKAAAN